MNYVTDQRYPNADVETRNEMEDHELEDLPVQDSIQYNWHLVW